MNTDHATLDSCIDPSSPPAKLGLFAMLREDVACVFKRDPAARSTLELLTIYPGIQALVMHRLAHAMWLRGLRYLPRLLSFLTRLLTNVDIHPAACIGRRFFIDHGACVVIGETAEIGDDVTLYHGVTLGGTTWSAGKRHPTLGSGVIVGAGAKILGAITVGDRARVAANSVVIEDVSPGMTVVGIPGRMVLPKSQRRIADGGIDLDHHQMPDPVGKALACLLERIADLEREIGRLKGDLPAMQGACRDCDDTCSQPAFDGSLHAADIQQGVKRHG
ncbi:serine O-acetyltransferase [Methyloversatilis sp. XJ19-49]|nr:serine O-acetyltransferase [Methyloversatilis sp. XJ19-49]MCQ9378200.1 serine O-acetyltransferase [Methyloversatilis sp. XJ19-49]